MRKSVAASGAEPPFCITRGCISGPVQRASLEALRDALGWCVVVVLCVRGRRGLLESCLAGGVPPAARVGLSHSRTHHRPTALNTRKQTPHRPPLETDEDKEWEQILLH